MAKNECAKMRTKDNPYEIWQTSDGSWEWRVLKKYQADDDKPYARWFCAVKTPYTRGGYDMGDVYVAEIKSQAKKKMKDNEYFRSPDGKISDKKLSPYGKKMRDGMLQGAELYFADGNLIVKKDYLVSKTGEKVVKLDNDRIINKIIFRML